MRGERDFDRGSREVATDCLGKKNFPNKQKRSPIGRLELHKEGHVAKKKGCENKKFISLLRGRPSKEKRGGETLALRGGKGKLA